MGKTLIKWFKDLCIKLTVSCPDCHYKFCQCGEDRCPGCNHDMWDCLCCPWCVIDNCVCCSKCKKDELKCECHKHE